VFTQYDRLVRTIAWELSGKEDEDEDRDEEEGDIDINADSEVMKRANKKFRECLDLVEERLKVQMPDRWHARVSGMFASSYCLVLTSFLVLPGYEKDVSDLVEVTKDVAQKRVKGDAWVLWSITQRANLPVKIEACIEYVSSTHILTSR
jgi:hypothetical protein